ncbi:MAG: hypothetical protein K2N54_05600 [Helicobacter sp.]|nr:hypothetical protein [Helicobacter sp.]
MYDFEKEKEKLEKLSERAHRLVFRLHTMSADKIDVDSPKPNVEALQNAQAALIELELLLPQLKEQLEYMHKCERERAVKQRVEHSETVDCHEASASRNDK